MVDLTCIHQHLQENTEDDIDLLTEYEFDFTNDASKLKFQALYNILLAMELTVFVVYLDESFVESLFLQDQSSYEESKESFQRQ